MYLWHVDTAEDLRPQGEVPHRQVPRYPAQSALGALEVWCQGRYGLLPAGDNIGLSADFPELPRVKLPIELQMLSHTFLSKYHGKKT